MKTRKEIGEAFNKFLKVHNAYEAYYRYLNVSVHSLEPKGIIYNAFDWEETDKYPYRYWEYLNIQWLRFLNSINSK